MQSKQSEFDNKVVLVTGSSSGIGEATAVLFAKLGAQLVITGRDQHKLARVANDCERVSPNGLKALQVMADLAKEEDITALMDAIVTHFDRLDVLVNNAGMGGGQDMEPLDVFDQFVRVNLRAAYQLCSLALPLLEKSKGVVVNNSSICALKPLPSSVSYSVTKAALDMLTRSLAQLWGQKGIRVNSVNPGHVDTPIFSRYGKRSDEELQQMWQKVSDRYPLKRCGTTEDIAKAIVFLASQDSSFITGIQLRIDGGFLDAPTIEW